ncbi:MAG: macro domain-containing protein [Oscillospiraceae bacterium]|nr:macro domain-containing protein [Oscillospiraceae bacterium]
MPIQIVRNDIVNVQVDAIVNTANPKPVVGYGCDAGIHKKAGPQLLSARQMVGDISVGDVAVTPGFGLDANYVIHAVGPVWRGGSFGEEQQLRQCYDRALQAALEQGCESIAFPLLSAGNHGFPKPLALQIALNAFSSFLVDHEMEIYLVIFGSSAFELSQKLFHSIASYIDANYVQEKILDEYGVTDKHAVDEMPLQQIEETLQKRFRSRRLEVMDECCAPMCAAPGVYGEVKAKNELDDLLEQTDAGFSETLLKLIDRTGKKDSEIYKKANVDRKLFSKIRNNPNYKPSKTTALAFAIALELDLEETKDFIGRAGYALSRSSKFDIIIEYFIMQKNYDIFEINSTLFSFDQSLLGA